MSRPLHWKEAISKTASKLNLSEEQVKEIVLWYWRKFRKEMSATERTKAVIPGFGTFYIKPWKVDKDIERIRKSLRTLSGKTRDSLKNWLAAERYRAELRRLRAIKKELKKEELRKSRIRKKQNIMREEYYPQYLQKLREQGLDEKIIKSLEQQAANMGGDCEHNTPQTLCRTDSEETFRDLPVQ